MKLHLGCGDKYIPDWTHIDVADYPHIQIRHAVDSLPMVKDSTIEVIYACHVLEHFLFREIPRVLDEWRRILIPDGILRLAVPDFEAVNELYQKTHNLNLVRGLLFGRQDYLYNFHNSVFDYTTLSNLLLEAGFKTVSKYDWRQTEHATLDDYSQAYFPHMDKEHGQLMSLNVEAVKNAFYK